MKYDIILRHIVGDIMHTCNLIEECLTFSRKWSFDKEYLRMVIEEGRKMLENKDLSRRARQSIKVDIETFSRFVDNDFELKDYSSYDFSTPNNIDKLRDCILFRMKKQYDILGEDLIKFVIDLSDSGIFYESRGISEITKLSMEEQVELIIKNYERNIPKFVNPAKEIMIDDKIRQIQVIDSDDSYCHYDYITKKSYILVNMMDAPCIFNHEVEHAIEEYYNYHTNTLYDELGAILNEMLFNEEVYKMNGYLYEGDYDFRLDEANYLLKSVHNYFKIMLLFAGKNFNISTDELIDTFVKYEDTSKMLVLEYLREDIATNWMLGNIGYLVSFLKALELRELFINNSKDSFYILEHYLKNKKFAFRKPKDGFMLYSGYIDSVKSRVRRK